MPAHTSCIICGSPDVSRVVEIPPLPIDTNRLWVSRADARAAPKSRISLAHCNDCGHVFNCNYNDDLVNYEVDYENSQIFSPRFRRYVEELADTLIARHDLRHKHIVEIGGGTGDLLRSTVKPRPPYASTQKARSAPLFEYRPSDPYQPDSSSRMSISPL